MSDLGQHQEALDATVESMELYRGLARGTPDVFLPELAMSLSILHDRLSGLGLYEKALKVAVEPTFRTSRS